MSVSGAEADDAADGLPPFVDRVVNDALRDANRIARYQVVGVVAEGVCAGSGDDVEDFFTIRMVMWRVVFARVDEDEPECLLRVWIDFSGV